jgi:hypothetical protein
VAGHPRARVPEAAALSETLPARITVTREHPRDMGQRHVLVYLDERKVGSLLPGQSLTREVPPGPHRLKAHNTLFGRTIEVDVKPGQHLRFVTANVPGFMSWLVWVLGAGPIYVLLEPVATDT